MHGGFGVLIGFFNKRKDTARGSNRSRRQERLYRQALGRVVRLAIVICLPLLVAGYIWHSGAAGRAGEVIGQQALQASAKMGFRVNDILVVGRKQISEEELLTHLGVHAQTPIFGVDLLASQKMLSTLSWIEDVYVTRRLPDKIVITLKERTPAALWQYQKKISLVDRNGVVISDADLALYKGLPLIVGDEAPRHVAELIDLLRAEPSVAARLQSATRVGQRRWDLRLEGNIVARLPERDAGLGLSRLAAILKREDQLAEKLSIIDLRLPEKLTVTLKPATPAQTAVTAQPEKQNI